MQNTERPPYKVFYSKFRCCNYLQTEYMDHVNQLSSDLTKEQAFIKMKLSKPPPTGSENYL